MACPRGRTLKGLCPNVFEILLALAKVIYESRTNFVVTVAPYKTTQNPIMISEDHCATPFNERAKNTEADGYS